MRRTTLFLAAILAAAAAGPAMAAFNVCNRAGLPARVAIGRFDGTSWTSQGWWTIKPKGCARRGLDTRGFFEVDTGKKPDWTQSLSN